MRKIKLTKAQIKRECKKLLQLNLQNISLKELKQKINNILINSWTNIIGRADKYEIIRARKGKFNNIKELWYPPKELINSFGRLNDKQEQIFYCSFGHNASLGSLEEIKVKKGDYVTQIFSDLLSDKSYKLCGLGNIEEWMKEKDNKIKKLYEYNELDLKHKIGIKEFNKNKFIRDCLNKVFIKKVKYEYKYKLSIAIAHLYFEKFEMKGILYPSVATNKKSVNLALRPQVADQFIKFKYARIIKILDITDDGYKLKLKNEAYDIDEKGNFKWLY